MTIDAPSTRRRVHATLWITLALWGANVALFSLASALSGRASFETTGARLLLAVVGIGFCWGIYWVLRRLKGGTFWRRVAVMALLAPVVGEAFAWINYFGLSFVQGRRISFDISWSDALFVLAHWTWFFCAWTALIMAIDYYFDVQEEEIRTRDLMNYANAMKLRALYQQVNPHFLFNSLNSISALVGDHRNEEADRMIDLLANYFRRTLTVDPTRDLKLEEEVAMQREYLGIEQLRFADLAVSIDIPEELRNASVPALVLQPLVENAIKHGIAAAAGPGRIALDAHREGDALVLAVRNSGAAKPGNAAGTRTGLHNLRERLEARYGVGGASVQVGPTPDGGYAAVVKLPFKAAA